MVDRGISATVSLPVTRSHIHTHTHTEAVKWTCYPVSPDALTWGKKSMAQYLHCSRQKLPERRMEGATGRWIQRNRCLRAEKRKLRKETEAKVGLMDPDAVQMSLLKQKFTVECVCGNANVAECQRLRWQIQHYLFFPPVSSSRITSPQPECVFLSGYFPCPHAAG